MLGTKRTLFMGESRAADVLAEMLSVDAAREACAGLVEPSAREGMLAAVLLATPLGPMLAATGDDGVWMLEFVDRAGMRAQGASMRRRSGRGVGWGEHPRLRLLEAWVRAYFRDPREVVELPTLAPGAGSAFQERVWAELRRIPAGETCSYAQLAARIGTPAAVRAVACANATNRVALIIPCHRVIGSDGTLTGYAGGLRRKAWLLAHERAR